MGQQRKIVIQNQGSDIKEFIKTLKEDLIETESINSSVFGDENKRRMAHNFNSLDEWEKNLIAMYLYVKSCNEMEKYLNIKKSTINNILRDIKRKIY